MARRKLIAYAGKAGNYPEWGMEKKRRVRTGLTPREREVLAYMAKCASPGTPFRLDYKAAEAALNIHRNNIPSIYIGVLIKAGHVARIRRGFYTVTSVPEGGES
jgi:predicted transcriptional regulator of viral defense system